MRERLVAQEPARADYLRDLSVSYNKLGDLERDLGHGDAARQFLEKDLEIAERLAAQEPARADYLRNLPSPTTSWGIWSATGAMAMPPVSSLKKPWRSPSGWWLRNPRAPITSATFPSPTTSWGIWSAALGHGDAARQFFEKALEMRRAAGGSGTRARRLLSGSRQFVGSNCQLNHIQRALDILLHLQRTGRLSKADEPKIAAAQQLLQHTKSQGD